MNESMNEKYRRLFQARAVTDQTAAGLRGRVVEAVHARTPVMPRRIFRLSRPTLICGRALAAVAALCLLVWYLVPRASSPPSGVVKLAVHDDTAIPPERRAAGALLFREMEALFGRQLDWVCETGSEVRLGLHAAAAPAASAPLLVRLTVQRQDERQQWQKYQQADLLVRDGRFTNINSILMEPGCPHPGTVRDGRFTEIISGACRNMRLHLWAQLTPTGRVAVFSSLILPDGAAYYLNDVVHDGVSREMAYLNSVGGYRVIQTIHSLPDSAG